MGRTATKLYAVRDSKGRFKDIQTCKRAHGQAALYKVVHTTKCGVDIYIARSAKEPTEEQVIAAMGINFDEEDEDYIDIEKVEKIYYIKDRRPNEHKTRGRQK